MKRVVERFFNQMWYEKKYRIVSFLLLPLSLAYRVVTAVRWLLYRLHVFKRYQSSLPIVVVGGLTVGGVGKTPFISAVARHLMDEGLKPAIVSRGYGGSEAGELSVVTASSDPAIVGDEPVMLAKQLGCDIIVCVDRVAAIKEAERLGCDCILSDDGLQHWRFHRDMNIVIIDGSRGLGNGRCLPAGPLREAQKRLQSVDLVLYNMEKPGKEQAFYFSPTAYRCLGSGECLPLDHFEGQSVHAVCGIGNPQRFFRTLGSLGCEVSAHAFPDHHAFESSDLVFEDEQPVVMTEKDAIKCQGWGLSNHYVLIVLAKIKVSVLSDILASIKTAGK